MLYINLQIIADTQLCRHNSGFLSDHQAITVVYLMYKLDVNPMINKKRSNKNDG